MAEATPIIENNPNEKQKPSLKPTKIPTKRIKKESQDNSISSTDSQDKALPQTEVESGSTKVENTEIEESSPAIDELVSLSREGMNSRKIFALVMIPTTTILIVLLVWLFLVYSDVQNLKKENEKLNKQLQTISKQVNPKLPVNKPNFQTDNWKGKSDARYVWIEYADLQCSFCKQIHPNLQKIIQDYPNVAWVYRHLPIHEDSDRLAQIVECSRDQKGNDGFWMVTDKIFAEQKEDEKIDLLKIAGDVSLDATTLQSCVNEQKYAEKIQNNAIEAAGAGIKATPTGILYDMQDGRTKLVEGAMPYQELQLQLTSFMSD